MSLAGLPLLTVFSVPVGLLGGALTWWIFALTAAGLNPECVALDPGIGFGKTMEHNLALLANLNAVRRGGRPICLGVSRKGTLGVLTGRDRSERMPGSLAVACFAVAEGATEIIRTHDVGPTRDAVVLFGAINPHRRKESL